MITHADRLNPPNRKLVQLENHCLINLVRSPQITLQTLKTSPTWLVSEGTMSAVLNGREGVSDCFREAEET
jgi:hypothetical protein